MCDGGGLQFKDVKINYMYFGFMYNHLLIFTCLIYIFCNTDTWFLDHIIYRGIICIHNFEYVYLTFLKLIINMYLSRFDFNKEHF